MPTIELLLKNKGEETWTISPDQTVYEALKFMAEKDIGALPVVEGGRLAGIFSERDYARKIVLHGKSSMDTPVSAIMTTDVVTITPSQTVDDCMHLMTDKHIRHLPVMEGQKLVGIISIGDVVKAVISEQAFKIGQLESYIQGS